MSSHPQGIPEDVIETLEDEVAGGCKDCGCATEFRDIQRGGRGGFLLRFTCPECDPERVQLKQVPDWLQVGAEAEGDGDESRFECPECNARYDQHVTHDGKQGCCPVCGEKVREDALEPGQDQLDRWSS